MNVAGIAAGLWMQAPNHLDDRHDFRFRQVPMMFALAARAAVASVVALAALATPSPSAAEPLTLEYRSYLLGLPIASASATIELVGDRYRVRGQLQSGGIVSLFAPWTQEAISAGRLGTAGTVSAERHWQSGTFRGKARHLDLVYSSEQAVVTSATPDPHDRDPEKRVPAHLTGGTTDAMSGLLAVARQVSEGRGCEATIRVFDGRRRYDATFSESDGAGGGPEDAVGCRFLITEIAGFSKKGGIATDPERPGRIWFRPAGPDTPAIPVRLETATDWGTAVVELVRLQPASRAVAAE